MQLCVRRHGLQLNIFSAYDILDNTMYFIFGVPIRRLAFGMKFSYTKIHFSPITIVHLPPCNLSSIMLIIRRIGEGICEGSPVNKTMHLCCIFLK